jgi:3-hydroxyisobutyrate dehydrogenase-like beta-hydroxyacid dehydrogenase
MTETRARVGFVGAGEMGTPMVDRLLAAGSPVTVLARRPEVAERYAGSPARVVSSLGEVAEGADIVIVCVLTDAQVAEVALGEHALLAAMAPGSLLVVHTTGSPSTATRLAEDGAERGVRVIDAPVSGGPADIVAGHITLLLGGDDTDVERVRPVLAAYADPILHLGPLGSGQVVKLINNALFAANIQLAAEAERVADQLGVDIATLASTVAHCSGASYAMGVIAAMGSTEALTVAAGRFLRKDVDMVTAVAAELGVDLGLLASVADGDPATFAY